MRVGLNLQCWRKDVDREGHGDSLGYNSEKDISQLEVHNWM